MPMRSTGGGGILDQDGRGGGGESAAFILKFPCFLELPLMRAWSEISPLRSLKTGPFFT